MQFALVSPEITRQFVEREQLRDRAREVHTRASVAIALLDAVLKRHRSVCRCGFGLDRGATHCIACGHDVAERREIEHLESPVRVIGRGTGTYKALPDGSGVAEIEYLTGGRILGVL